MAGTSNWSVNFSQTGSICNAPSQPIVTSVWACRAAMHFLGVVGDEFGGTETEPSFPKGCVMYKEICTSCY